jgi:hypothetical protein
MTNKITFSQGTMGIHWKALEEHFLMVALIFRFNHFWGRNAFSEFFSENLNPNEMRTADEFARNF